MNPLFSCMNRVRATAVSFMCTENLIQCPETLNNAYFHRNLITKHGKVRTFASDNESAKVHDGRAKRKNE